MTKQPARTVMPIIAVDSIDELHDFYTEKLGFKRVMGMVGKDGQFDFVSYDLNGAQIMFTRTRQPMDAARPSAGKRPVEIYLEVDDVDAYHRAVSQHGVKITTPLTTQWWGDRTFTIMDPYGYQIWFHQKQVAEMKPPQGAKLV
ncbi:MAG TPA: VOC family protein [bacterium]|nr:VOC family protein [bacterium]